MARKQSKSKIKESSEAQVIRLHATADGPMAPASEAEIDRLKKEALKKREERRQIRIDNHIKEQRGADDEVSLLHRGLLLGFIVLFLLGTFSVVNLYANVSDARTKVASLKTEYASLSEKNRALEEKISDSVDPQEIFRMATENLNMVYPDSSQIITYHKDTSRRVIANEKIPEK